MHEICYTSKLQKLRLEILEHKGWTSLDLVRSTPAFYYLVRSEKKEAAKRPDGNLQ